MSATVDGAAWAAIASNLKAEADDEVPGGIEIGGTGGGGLDSRRMTINLYNISSPGTYPLGVTATIFGGYATFARTNGAIWHTALNGGAGEVVVTDLTASRIRGNFSFEGSPFPFTPATGTIVVASGSFDVPIEGTVLPVPDGIGSTLRATFDGAMYNASYVAVTGVAAGNWVISTSTEAYTLTFYLSEVAGPGVYPIRFDTPFRTALVQAGVGAPPGMNCCWGANPGDTGDLTIETLTERRATGTFSARLVPQDGTSAAETLVIADGVFDVGLDPR
ncbi:MAG: hypothetical protein EHM19_05760 [Candidatus Latescibacterota bacterium]|nr:MAG: hypothetical protein EHM19_05760 [Candidatus Latescibacterota bacterium]